MDTRSVIVTKIADFLFASSRHTPMNKQSQHRDIILMQDNKNLRSDLSVLLKYLKVFGEKIRSNWKHIKKKTKGETTMKLNLETQNKQHEIVKEYLENNVSENLSDKINNGVKVTKDDKELINQKDLVGFINYAYEQAKAMSEKGATCACIEDKTVFGWAIHYFEEDSILGKLYNLDGTEYQPPKPKYEPKNIVSTPKPKANTQLSLFDLPSKDKQEETLEVKQSDKELDAAIKGEYITEDGEIIDYADFDGCIEEPTEHIKPEINNNAYNNTLSYQNDTLKMLFDIFGNDLEVKP